MHSLYFSLITFCWNHQVHILCILNTSVFKTCQLCPINMTSAKKINEHFEFRVLTLYSRFWSNKASETCMKFFFLFTYFYFAQNRTHSEDFHTKCSFHTKSFLYTYYFYYKFNYCRLPLALVDTDDVGILSLQLRNLTVYSSALHNFAVKHFWCTIWLMFPFQNLEISRILVHYSVESSWRTQSLPSIQWCPIYMFYGPYSANGKACVYVIYKLQQFTPDL